jgi:hypothetical protein
MLVYHAVIGILRAGASLAGIGILRAGASLAGIDILLAGASLAGTGILRAGASLAGIDILRAGASLAAFAAALHVAVCCGVACRRLPRRCMSRPALLEGGLRSAISLPYPLLSPATSAGFWRTSSPTGPRSRMAGASRISPGLRSG